MTHFYILILILSITRCLPKKAINHLIPIFNSVLKLPILWEFSTIITVPKPNKSLDTVFLFAIHSRLPNHHKPTNKKSSSPYDSW